MEQQQANQNIPDRALQEPQESTTDLSSGELFPPPPKGSFRRSEKGKIVFRNCAQWVVDRLNASGLSVEEWFKRGANLRDIGISRATAVAELKPRIPEAHRWYSDHGEGRYFQTWEQYWAASLSNRLYYFFRKHNSEGRIEIAVAEWPGTVEEGVLIAPETPAIPSDRKGGQ